jgi:hypothetical protein
LAERAPNAAIDHHLAGEAPGSRVNGYGEKTVVTDTGQGSVRLAEQPARFGLPGDGVRAESILLSTSAFGVAPNDARGATIKLNVDETVTVGKGGTTISIDPKPEPESPEGHDASGVDLSAAS